MTGIIVTVIGGLLILPGGPFVHKDQPTPTPTIVFSPVSQPTTRATLAVPPHWVFVSANWNGTCTPLGGCPVTATFRNTGGPGNGSVTFHVIATATNQTLATCTTTLPHADTGDSSTTGCTANDSALGQFINAYVTRYGAGVGLPLRLYAQAT